MSAAVLGPARDLFDAFGHLLNAFFGQGETVQQGSFQAVGTGCGQVFGIGSEQRGAFAADGVSQVLQGGILLRGACRGQAA